MLNNISITGRLTKAPELKYTATNKPVLSFCIACDEGYGDNKQTDFIDLVAWNATAEFIARNFDRGDLMSVTGRLKTRTWEDGNGTKRKATEVRVQSVEFGESKRKTEPAASAPNPNAEILTPPAVPQVTPTADLDDTTALPFEIF